MVIFKEVTENDCVNKRHPLLDVIIWQVLVTAQ